MDSPGAAGGGKRALAATADNAVTESPASKRARLASSEGASPMKAKPAPAKFKEEIHLNKAHAVTPIDGMTVLEPGTKVCAVCFMTGVDLAALTPRSDLPRYSDA